MLANIFTILLFLFYWTRGLSQTIAFEEPLEIIFGDSSGVLERLINSDFGLFGYQGSPFTA
jgi:hypothetical protein